MWLALLLACAPVSHPEAPSQPQATAPAVVAPGTMPTRDAARATQVLTPSPAETRKAVRDAGIDVDLSTLVPRRLYVMDQGDPGVVALRTGVVLADLVLTVSESNDHDLLERLGLVQAGLTHIGAGEGLLSAVRGMAEGVRAGGASRPMLLQSLDELVALSVPNAGVDPGDRRGALMQAGAWMCVTDLVAAAVLQSGKIEAADALLHQGPTAAFFLAKVREEAQGRPATTELRGIEGRLATLRDLGAVAKFGEAEVRQIRDNTAAMLDLL